MAGSHARTKARAFIAACVVTRRVREEESGEGKQDAPLRSGLEDDFLTALLGTKAILGNFTGDSCYSWCPPTPQPSRTFVKAATLRGRDSTSAGRDLEQAPPQISVGRPMTSAQSTGTRISTPPGGIADLTPWTMAWLTSVSVSVALTDFWRAICVNR
jgi:hypothetical protein